MGVALLEVAVLEDEEAWVFFSLLAIILLSEGLF